MCVGCCRGGGQRPCSLFRWVGPYFSGVFSGLCAAGPLLQDPQRIHGTYWSFFNLRYRAGLQLSGIMLIYPNAFWLYIKGGHTRLTLLVCLIQSSLYWLTWNTPRKINKTKKPTFEKSPWSRGENYPTKWVWRFSRSSHDSKSSCLCFNTFLSAFRFS